MRVPNHYLAQLNPFRSPQAVAQIIAWAHQAGQIAMRYFGHVSPDYKPDDTLLTQADVEIEQFLVTQIRAAFPDHALICEEGGRVQAKTASPYAWAVDPLDGTTAFVLGLPGWGIALGLLYEGQPVFGLFYMPLLDDLTYTAADGVWSNGQILRQAVQPDWGRKGFLAVNSGAHHDFQIDVLRTRALGGVGASLVYTARGSAAAVFIPRAYVWDLVAGGAILSQAGGELRYLSSKPVEYLPLLDGRLAPEPIIAGHPDLLVELRDAIRLRNQDDCLG
jgi:fructose-1,6-bisphosphatase/inositol monophosphatase family enzyme